MHAAYSTDPTSYHVYWKGFADPHSGLAYFRVGLGSQPAMSDVIPFVYVGLQTCQLSCPAVFRVIEGFWASQYK